MKIYTITCHDVYNAGSSLQAYALSTYIRSLGHDVEVIDYKPDYLSKHYNVLSISNPKYEMFPLNIIYILLKLPKRIIALFSKRKRLYDIFKKRYLKCTKKKYLSNEELRKLNDGDIYITGSDQVWNTFFKNGKDPSFYLDFAPKDSIKASYAASFATKVIHDSYDSKIKKWLENINYISVRESSGIEILDKLGIKGAINVLDPVFLIDKNEWIDLALNSTLKLKDKYILVYDFDNSFEIENYARKIARKYNCKIYSVLNLRYADQCFINGGPLEFLYLILNAEFIISNSFHATAFSLIFEKQFTVINRVEEINTRMEDLMKLFEIVDVNAKKDYKIINTKLDYYRSISKNYINKILDREGYNNE